MFLRDSSEVSISSISPVTRDIGGLIDDPILTNLEPGLYAAVTELVADDTIVRSKESPTLNV